MVVYAGNGIVSVNYGTSVILIFDGKMHWAMSNLLLNCLCNR